MNLTMTNAMQVLCLHAALGFWNEVVCLHLAWRNLSFAKAADDGGFGCSKVL